MNTFVDYIETALQDVPDDGTLYRYKRLVLDRMSERAQEVRQTGLKDEKVLQDLIISQFPHLHENYEKYAAQEHKKQRESAWNKFMLFGTPGVIIGLLIVFVGISFLTDAWSQTWVIIVGGILAWITLVLSVFVRRISEMRRLLHPIARVLLALAVMCVATIVFLVCLVVLHVPKAWLVYPISLILMYVADAIFAYKTKQKLRVINYLVYIPAAMPMLYVLLGALGVIPWSPGWLLMPLSILMDLAIIVGVMANNSKYKYKQEVDDAWNEN